MNGPAVSTRQEEVRPLAVVSMEAQGECLSVCASVGAARVLGVLVSTVSAPSFLCLLRQGLRLDLALLASF